MLEQKGKMEEDERNESNPHTFPSYNSIVSNSRGEGPDRGADDELVQAGAVAEAPPPLLIGARRSDEHAVDTRNRSRSGDASLETLQSTSPPSTTTAALLLADVERTPIATIHAAHPRTADDDVDEFDLMTVEATDGFDLESYEPLWEDALSQETHKTLTSTGDPMSAEVIARWAFEANRFSLKYSNPLIEQWFLAFSSSPTWHVCLYAGVFGLTYVAAGGKNMTASTWTTKVFFASGIVLWVAAITIYVVVQRFSINSQTLKEMMTYIKRREAAAIIVVFLSSPYSILDSYYCSDPQIRDNSECAAKVNAYTQMFTFAPAILAGTLRSKYTIPLIAAIAMLRIVFYFGLMVHPWDVLFKLALVEVAFACAFMFALHTLERVYRGRFEAWMVLKWSELQVQRHRTEAAATLSAILPAQSITKLLRNEPVYDYNPSTSVLMLSLFDYAHWCTEVIPVKAAHVIDNYFSYIDSTLAGDHVLRKFLHKVVTTGEQYVLALNLLPGTEHMTNQLQLTSRTPRSTPDTVLDATTTNVQLLYALRFAIQIMRGSKRLAKLSEEEGVAPFSGICGVGTGEALGGIMGSGKLSYSLHGAAIAEAARVSLLCTRARPCALTAMTYNELGVLKKATQVKQVRTVQGVDGLLSPIKSKAASLLPVESGMGETATNDYHLIRVGLSTMGDTPSNPTPNPHDSQGEDDVAKEKEEGVEVSARPLGALVLAAASRSETTEVKSAGEGDSMMGSDSLPPIPLGRISTEEQVLNEREAQEATEHRRQFLLSHSSVDGEESKQLTGDAVERLEEQLAVGTCCSEGFADPDEEKEYISGSATLAVADMQRWVEGLIQFIAFAAVLFVTPFEGAMTYGCGIATTLGLLLFVGRFLMQSRLHRLVYFWLMAPMYLLLVVGVTMAGESIFNNRMVWINYSQMIPIFFASRRVSWRNTGAMFFFVYVATVVGFLFIEPGEVVKIAH